MKCTVDNYLNVKRGNELPQSRLTDTVVTEIRKLHAEKIETIAYLNEQYSAKALAAKYGVHIRTIEKVLAYETWRHI